jgi:hypothetical protein
MQSSTSFEDSVSIALQYAEIVGATGRSRLQVVECDIAYADFYNAGAESHTEAKAMGNATHAVWLIAAVLKDCALLVHPRHSRWSKLGDCAASKVAHATPERWPEGPATPTAEA